MIDYDICSSAAEYIKSRVPGGIKTAVILGSGLGKTAELVKEKTEIPYENISGFAKSTVDSHKGALISGKLFGAPCIILSGRFHFYEGYDFSVTAFPVYVMKLLGVENLIVTNAAGGINESFSPGDYMLITDHIKFTVMSPVIGKNDTRFGERFFDMTNAYDKDFIRIAKAAAQKSGVDLKSGVYAYMAGPQFETPAEIKMLRTLGADAVGMSTVAEVIAAAHCGLRVLGISCISNMAAGITGEPLSDDEVCEITQSSSAVFNTLLENILPEL